MRKLPCFDTKEESLNQIRDYLKNEYEMDVCGDKEMTWMEMAMYMSRRKFKKVIEETEEEDVLTKSLFDNVLYPDNYERDIQIGIYMHLGLATRSGKRAHPHTLMVYASRDKDSEKWGKESMENFPLPIGDQDGIVWCGKYQDILLGRDYIDMFDFGKKGNDITRYGYQKIRGVEDAFKDTDVENRILLDMSMGISLTETIYRYLRNVTNKGVLEKFSKIIKKLGSIGCLLLRNNIANSVFYLIEASYYSRECIDKCLEALKKICPVINEYYNDLLYLRWWDTVHEREFSGEMYLQDESGEIEAIWQCYYNNDDLYEEWLEAHGIYKFKYQNHPTADAFDGLKNIENYSKVRNDVVLMCENKDNIERMMKSAKDGYGKMESGEDAKPKGGNIVECDDGYMIGKTIKGGKIQKDNIKTVQYKLDKIRLYAVIHKTVVSSCLPELRKRYVMDE